MQKIYFDTNIFSQLRANEGKEYEELNAFIENNRDNLFIPFSRAHIDDLINDPSDEKFADATFIENLTINNYFFYDFIKHEIKHNLQRPINLLTQELEPKKESPFENLLEMFDSSDDPELKKLHDMLKQLLSAKIHRLDVDEDKLRPQDSDYISRFLPPVNTNLSIADFYDAFQNMNNQLTDKSTFKDMRRYNLDVFSAFTNIKEITLESVNAALINSPIKKDLSGLIASHN